MARYIVYALPETRPGRVVRPVVCVRIGARERGWSLAWDSVHPEAIEVTTVQASGVADARSLYRAAMPGASVRRPGGV